MFRRQPTFCLALSPSVFVSLSWLGGVSDISANGKAFMQAARKSLSI